MPIAFQVTENRNWVEWVVGMASLGVIQSLGVAVALNLWRLKPKGRPASAMHMNADRNEEQTAAQTPQVTVIFDGGAAENSKSAIREIWRGVPNQ
jgi:hypothetical protein